MEPESSTYCTKIIFVRAGRCFKPLRTDQIVWIAAEGNYVHIHTTSERYTVRIALGALVELLAASELVRIHKSAAVNLFEVDRLENWFSGEMLVFLKNGLKLKMGRKYRQDLKLKVRFLV
jgi:two-component system LytT family response regulator